MPLRVIGIQRKRSKCQHGVWEKWIPALVEDFEGFKFSVEGITTDVGKIAPELEPQAEPDDGTELLQAPDKT